MHLVTMGIGRLIIIIWSPSLVTFNSSMQLTQRERQLKSATIEMFSSSYRYLHVT
jgi:hypothetical protein